MLSLPPEKSVVRWIFVVSPLIPANRDGVVNHPAESKFVNDDLARNSTICSNKKPSRTSRWWFQTFFIFTPIWGRFPFWLIFFRYQKSFQGLGWNQKRNLYDIVSFSPRSLGKWANLTSTAHFSNGLKPSTRKDSTKTLIIFRNRCVQNPYHPWDDCMFIPYTWIVALYDKLSRNIYRWPMHASW